MKGTLKQWRMFNGLTMEEFSQALGVKSIGTIRNWETGITQPNAKYIEQIEQVLNIKWDDVILVQKDLR